jgi:hypothetical protein
MADDRQDVDVFIPCEVCEEMIRWNDYNDHVQECSRAYRNAAPVLSTFFPMLSRGLEYLASRSGVGSGGLGNHRYQTPDSQGSGDESEDQGSREDQGDGDGADETSENHVDESEIQPSANRLLLRFSVGAQIGNLVSITNLASIGGPFDAVQIPDQEFDQWVSDVLGTVQVGVPDLSAVMVPRKATEADGMCTICQEALFQELREVVALTCNHAFCRECIERWLSMSKKCPTCMMPVCD